MNEIHLKLTYKPSVSHVRDEMGTRVNCIRNHNFQLHIDSRNFNLMMLLRGSALVLTLC